MFVVTIVEDDIEDRGVSTPWDSNPHPDRWLDVIKVTKPLRHRDVTRFRLKKIGGPPRTYTAQS